MIISDDISVMLLVEPFFKTFVPHKEISDAKKTTEVLLCISAESRAKVDEMIALALEEGGTTPVPKQDHGWMYAHSFEDLDGHIWEIAFIDETAIPQNP
jgi:predicted lactoylglutathione lyase